VVAAYKPVLSKRLALQPVTAELVNNMASAAISQFPCVNCGANTTFGPGTGALLCGHCGHAEPIESSTQNIVENDYRATLAKQSEASFVPQAVGTTDIQCKNCGARVTSSQQSQRCPFCDSAMIVELPPEPTLLPQAVLPFELKRESAQNQFSAWLKSRWFAPSKLVDRSKRDGLDGVYLPYWTYDSDTITNYRGERGDHYWVSESYKDSDGETKTKQVRKTRWSNSSGTVDNRFDDVLICATTSLPVKLTQRLEPWDMEKLASFNPRYLAGFIAERQKLDIQPGFEQAQQRMEPDIERSIRSDIGGDEQRISSKDTEYRNVTWKHVLMPLWLSAFHYNDKVFRVIVNARTGEVSGERPYSKIKIALFVLTICAAIAAIIWLIARR
jgi:hypothetical protein